MPSDGTIGGLIGKLDVLRVECPMCGRRGRYRVDRGSALYAIVSVAAFTGARRNEILALRWSDLSFDAKSLTIARSLEDTKKHGRGTKEPTTIRGRRTIVIDDHLVELLRG